MKLSSLKQQIEELDAKATKGPWHPVCQPFTGMWYLGKIEDHQARSLTGKSDAEFSALSRTAMPELLRRLLVAEEALAAIYCAADDSEGQSDDPVAKAYSKALDVIISEADAALKTIRGEEE